MANRIQDLSLVDAHLSSLANGLADADKRLGQVEAGIETAEEFARLRDILKESRMTQKRPMPRLCRHYRRSLFGQRYSRGHRPAAANHSTGHSSLSRKSSTVSRSVTINCTGTAALSTSVLPIRSAQMYGSRVPA